MPPELASKPKSYGAKAVQAHPSRIRRARDAIGRRLASIPLRVTLVLALVALSALGLLASGAAVTSAFEQSLLDQTDQQLREAGMSRMTVARPPLPFDQRMPPSPFYIVTENESGPGTLVLKPFDVDARPDLTEVHSPRAVTIGSLDDSPVRWRALSLRAGDTTTTVAVPLTKNADTVNRLIKLQLMIGAVVLAVLAVLAYFVIQRSLRPLSRVENIAAAIARGDLFRRVPVRGTNTEVDRLSQSLNGMLAQIQSAFAATEASEASARESEATMRRFVADASHELRTPITTIRGFAELYRQTGMAGHGATDDPARFIDRIEHEAQRMGLLVEDLLMLARLDAQRPLELGPVDLLTVASDAVHNARARAAAADPEGPRRPIELEIHSGAGTLEITGDEMRLRQVLANLIENALTHTPPEASVTVHLTPRSDDVLLAVADTGPGLPAEQAARIFERFYRTDTSRTRTSGGTGLGLSIVQALVTAHRGTVTVDSVEGEGTTFTVRLPREPD
ncbi:sensor histidine kinase [Nocardia goodfellowii]|uniref:histidine kinase n=1 Tax=Nocardia goodfellowii TaxID=882446 RepID=A0ABS4Q7N8_9NOCA|nr:HAMP domain-containing sensor histidine kinase [Nocardia goodfellowii]MBP2187677.1 two-component system OmpR family sensor kinase [Nocardia goodfellowii]